MPRMEHGFERAISEIFSGFLIGVLIQILSEIKIVPYNIHDYILSLKLIEFLGLVSLVYVTPYWGTGYLIGWLFGVYIMAKAGLLGISELIFYFVIPLIVLLARFAKL